jgi:hypothetical protein
MVILRGFKAIASVIVSAQVSKVRLGTKLEQFKARPSLEEIRESFQALSKPMEEKLV